MTNRMLMVLRCRPAALLVLSSILAACALAITAPGASAAIVRVSDEVRLIPAPDSIVSGRLENYDFAVAFNGQQHIQSTPTWPANYPFVMPMPGERVGQEPTWPTAQIAVPIGTRLSGHFVHLDREGRANDPESFEGTLHFEDDVVGIAVTSTTYNVSTTSLAPLTGHAGGVRVVTGPQNYLSSSTDWLELSNDGRSLTFNVRLSGGADLKQFIVITKSAMPTPDTTIESGPDGIVTGPVSFEFSADQSGVGFECAVDTGAFAPCSSPRGLGLLANGPHVFSARAVKGTGDGTVHDPTPATRHFYVDTNGNVGLTGDVKRVSTAPASLAVDAFEDSSRVALIPERKNVAITSPTGVVSAPGLYNVDVGFATTALPLIPVSSYLLHFDPTGTSTASVVRSGSVRFDDEILGIQFLGSHLSTYDGLFGAPARTYSAEAQRGLDSSDYREWFRLSTDRHTVAFTMAAKQKPGFSLDQVRVITRVDAVAPQTTLITTPLASSESKSARFTFSSNETNSTFKCQTKLSGQADWGPWSPCVSGVTYPVPLGTHQFRVAAIDESGNEDASPAPETGPFTWTVVDLTAPTTTITAGPVANGGTTDNRAGQFSFRSSEPGSTFRCTLDGVDIGACSSPLQLPANLAYATHTFSVIATDPSGNSTAAPGATWTWVVKDTIAPNSVIGNPKPSTAPREPHSWTFNFTVTDLNQVTLIECAHVVGAATPVWEPCSSPRTITANQIGVQRFMVRGTDEYGNVETSVASHQWTVVADATKPIVTITHGPSGTVNESAMVDFQFTSNEPGSVFYCNLDPGTFVSGAYTLCSSPLYTGYLRAGVHTFSVYAVDQAGNSSVARTRTFTVRDDVAPNIVVVGPSSPHLSTSAMFSITSNEIATFQCRVDDEVTWQECFNGHEVVTNTVGPHRLYVRGWDLAGNESTEWTQSIQGTAFWSWDMEVNSDPLYVQLTDAPNGDVFDAEQLVAFTTNYGDAGVSYTCKLNDGPSEPCASPHVVTATTLGQENILLVSAERGGVPADYPVEVRWTWVENTPPSASLGAMTGPDADGRYTFEVAYGGYQASPTCWISGGEYGAGTAPESCSDATWTTPWVNFGTYVVHLRVVAGGSEAVATRSFSHAPIVPASCTARSGQPDASFNHTGLVRRVPSEAYPNGSEHVLSDSQGRIYYVGDGGNEVSITRLLRNGSVDSSYADQGRAAIAASTDRVIGSVDTVIGSDDALYLAVSEYDPNQPNLESSSMTKLTPTGVPDIAFGTGGRAVAGVSNGVRDLTIDSADRVYVATDHVDGLGIRRLTSAGAVDSTWMPSNATNALVLGLTGVRDRDILAANGSLYVGWRASNTPGYVQRFDATGSFDGQVELTTTGASTTFPQAQSTFHLIVDTEGRILASTFTGFGQNVIFRIVDGSLDASFGDGGASVLTRYFVPHTVRVDPDDRIVMTATDSSDQRETLIRVDTDGDLDVSFSDDGQADRPTNWRVGPGLTILPDGTYVSGGTEWSQQVDEAHIANWCS